MVPSTSTPSTSARTAAVASTVCHRRDAVVAGERRHPAAAPEGIEELGPLRRAGAQQERAQEVVELVGRGGGRLDLRPHPVDRLLGDPPQLLGRHRQAPPERDGARAPVDGLTVVEERVGRGVEDLVGEQRRLGGVDEVEAHLAVLHPPPQLDEPVAVERLGEAVVHRLARERVVGHLDGPADVLLARGGAGEHGGEQVVALHPLEGRRHLAPAAEAQHDQAAVEVPPPAALEDRLVEDGLLQRGPDRARG